uniref:Arrestin_C domain-containing protein n=1 Tax=Ascaris lumbricoides TaxID=6252 RepID=A0A0M3ICT0_ASCLU
MHVVCSVAVLLGESVVCKFCSSAYKRRPNLAFTGQLTMAGGGCCGGSEDIPCTAQVIEVKQDHAVLCWREAPDQLIYASRDAILTSQRHCENISLRQEFRCHKCALKVGDVVSVRVQLTNANSEVRWTALPGTVFFIQHTVLYEGVSKITMDSEEEGHMITERGLVRFQRRRCKYSGPFPNKLPSVRSHFGLVSDYAGEQCESEVIYSNERVAKATIKLGASMSETPSRR